MCSRTTLSLNIATDYYGIKMQFSALVQYKAYKACKYSSMFNSDEYEIDVEHDWAFHPSSETDRQKFAIIVTIAESLANRNWNCAESLEWNCRIFLRCSQATNANCNVKRVWHENEWMCVRARSRMNMNCVNVNAGLRPGTAFWRMHVPETTQTIPVIKVQTRHVNIVDNC